MSDNKLSQTGLHIEPNLKVVKDSRLNTPARVRRRARLERIRVSNSCIVKDRSNIWIKNNLNEQPVPSNTSDISKTDSKSQKSDLGIRFETYHSKGVANPSNAVEKAHKICDSSKKTPGKDFCYLSDENLMVSRSTSEKLSLSSCDSADSHRRFINTNLKAPLVQTKQSQKLKTLATLLPDEILSDSVNRESRQYSGALMFPDVSGFTQLCEKYDKTGKGGPSRLTEVLNGYIGSMIEIVLSRKGDVCKFGGDAFLCMWKATEDSSMMEIVHLAIESAVDIQKNCGEHKTDVGVKIGVKIAVSAGDVLFSIIGTETRKHYVIVGAPVGDVRDAEMLCVSGDVILTPSAWKYVKNHMLYSYTFHANNTHIKVHDFGPLWKSVKPKSNLKAGSADGTSSRPMLKYSSSLKMEDIRPFILPPVMKSIDLSQSLDYLTEMRQVAIVFFNIAVDFKSISEKTLIELSDRTFVIITGIVDKNDGAVNKLTLFDKDMAVLVVFGLKGFKHELASQIALKCAYACLELLKKLNVKSVTAGVTTGMAYCGVIGHTLRREYTVMGLPVNLAARLMCAYQNIVVCDRNTFLHSKLESGHFEVLEQKTLKGIHNAGPYYKFHLNPRRHTFKLDQLTYPLLGRSKEIEDFKEFLLNSLKKDNIVNFMIIFGKARIGKSRLVAYFINIAEKFTFKNEADTVNLRKRHAVRNKKTFTHYEICVVPLKEDDSKSSYAASQLIFQQALGISERSTIEEREDKILSKLGEVTELHLLATFNPIFNVNFDLMPRYLRMTQEQQSEAQKHMIRILYNKCFPKGSRWLIVIEDAEFMDENSWILLKWCAHENYTILYLITIGQRKVLTVTSLDCLETFTQKKILLSEIDKWHYAPLIGQILGVKAIPVELINLINSYRSSGNPGWLESFLLSLLQSGSIYITQLPSGRAKQMKLLTALHEPVLPSHNKPEEYEHANSGLSYWVDAVETFEHPDHTSHNITACLLGPNFFLGNENVEGELTMDTMFIKTIDTLRPLEQLVIKAGSVLGNSFRRKALRFLIINEMALEERALAKAIRNLFEIKILSCAKGDLTESNLLAPRRMMLVPSIRKEVACECIGVVVPDDCKDLPQYASCGYMQFRSPTFRDTVYNLLLDDQKKKFHYNSLEYLRKNTFKCKSCRSIPFDNIFGYDINSELKLACCSTPMYGVRSAKLEVYKKMPIPSFLYNVTHCCGESETAKALENNENEIHMLSSSEMGDCQCSQILLSVYSVLLEHAAGFGRKDIILEIQLEYASVSLTSYNVPLTMQILEEALALVNQMKEDKEYPEVCTPFIFSKIYTLMGATKFRMGRPDMSLEFLNTSLQFMKKKIPKSKAKLQFLIKKENFKHQIITEILPEYFIGRAPAKKGSYCDLLSECLGFLAMVNMLMQNWTVAKYASIVALNKALESSRNFFGLCMAYSNMIDVAYYNNDVQTCSKMEVCAIDVCRRCTKILEVYELEAVCRLFRVIFQTRHIRAEIEAAVLIGFQSIRIANVIRSSNLRLELMPDLIFALIQMNRLSEAVSLLQELEYLSLLDSDKSTRVWYHAICLDLQMDTGFTVLPFESCQQFIKEEEENLKYIRDINSKHRIYTSLWVWALRNEEWELSKPYGKTVGNFNLIDMPLSPCTVFTKLRRLEGFLILLVHRLDTRNIYTINLTYVQIHTLMSRLEKDVKVVKLLKPRFLLLKSYYRQIRFRDDSYKRTLHQALILCEKMKDINTAEWIRHLTMVWNNSVTPIQRSYWTEHSRFNLIDWHEAEGSKKKNVMYSLPLPKY